MARAAAAIEIRVERVSQLFNTFDPTPFRERDLDKDAEEFIVGWARELPADSRLQLIVHLPANETASAESHGLRSALGLYFTYRAETAQRELRDLLSVGRRSLLIGLTVLALGLIVGQTLSRLLHSELGKLLQEGLVILGWVANWRPIEIFLFDWWTVAQRRDLLRRLAQAKVEIRPEEPAPSIPSAA